MLHLSEQSVSRWPPETTGQVSGSCPVLNPPRISVVTPNYNYSHLLERTLCSVTEQHYPNLEYIVIDDGSTDDSMEWIQKHASKLAYFHHRPNKGQYPTINEGFEHATGDICAWINSDDIYWPWTFSVVAEIFTQHPDIDWIMGAPCKVQQGVPRAVKPAKPCPTSFVKAGLYEGGNVGILQQESMFWRKSLWGKAGGLNTQYKFAADYELWMRFAQHSELVACETPLGGFWVRGSNRSRSNHDRYREDMKKAVEALNPETQTLRHKLLKKLDYYYRTKSYTGLRGLTRRASRLDEVTGNVLKWDFEKQTYQLVTQKYF